MIIRADRLGGVLYQAVSRDGGRTWPVFASVTDIPNPGSKATLYALGGDAVALLHNSNSKRRAPLSLWISFDDGKTWPVNQVLDAGKAAYSDLAVMPDGTVLCLYEAETSIDCARFNLDWVTE